MAQTAHLHGGPWHGQTVTLEDGRDHFHIIEPVEPLLLKESDTTFTANLATREGMYSRVRDVRPNPDGVLDYEWDGWRSHD
jgi:hypothetical protein